MIFPGLAADSMYMLAMAIEQVLEAEHWLICLFCRASYCPYMSTLKDGPGPNR